MPFSQLRPAQSFTSKQTFTVDTGPEGDPFVVPTGVSLILAEMWSSGGGSGACGVAGATSGQGGPGTYGECFIPVIPGETLTIVKGPGGPGGPASRDGGSCGAGPSGIYRGTTPLFIVPTGPGGGGTGNSSGEHGGNGATGGDNASGENGQNGSGPDFGHGGTGATAPATGGPGGTGGGGNNGGTGVLSDVPDPATTGGSGVGGDAINSGGGGGAGGQGHYGGGGGEGGNSSGGGGGAYGIGVVHSSCYGAKYIKGSGTTVGNPTHPDYIAPHGNAGAAQTSVAAGNAGQSGLVVIRW